ncbi:hypothetical protein CSAL01_06799 [Colletotrichum salicis]|uniref:Uncharacterized protein n=1 Tax=Colletotrichum salicis TaxID=1209931 RepID=A0A135UV49_9PEZI|nr:hypothetical protein CSAL01_06799 [Colletotrichum salicis]
MQPTEILAILAGTYQLLNTSATRDGVAVPDRTYGSNPVGILSYSKSGFMSATITSTDPEDRPANLTFPFEDSQSDADWALVGKHSIGYAGPLRISDAFPANATFADVKMEAGMESLLQRCIKTAKELVDEASGLMIATDGKPLRWTKIKVSFRFYWKESKISGIQERLSFIKIEIFQWLQMLLFQHRRELSDHVGSLGDTSAAWDRATNARIDQMSKDIGKLLESTNEAALATELEAFSTPLSRFAEEAKNRGNILQILKCLRPRQLVVASHFFWGIRSGLQSSQEALLRTLLFQIMVQCPEIIPDIFPERYTSPTYALNPWTIETLLYAFERLRSIQLPSKCILVLIDGLDEYKGDHRDLVKFLSNTSQSHDIKICCASRPWPVFEDVYGDLTTRIQMDRLTATDMAIYVRDVLGQHKHYQSLLRSHEAEAIKLVKSISQKSEGVFFWVALVVKSLARGLDNWDDVGILQKRVLELPSDLDDFFQRMLDSIEDVYSETAYRTFSMLMIADMPVPVVCFLIMDTYFDDMMSFKSTNPFRSLKLRSAS